MLGDYGKEFIDRFSYDEVKNHIYPFIRNLFSANSENLDYTKEIAAKCPGLSTNGVFVFFTIAMDHIIHAKGIVEEVTFDMVNEWSIPTDVLYRTAIENLERLPLRFSSVFEDSIYQIDTSSEQFPNYECSWFLSKNILEKIKENLQDDFYIFPVSIWKTYIIRKKDAEKICGHFLSPSMVLAYIFSKTGFPTDNFLRHGYLYEEEELKLQELTASKKDTKVVGFPPSSN